MHFIANQVTGFYMKYNPGSTMVERSLQETFVSFQLLTSKHQLPKIVKHTQTIRREQPTNCLSVFYHFVGWRLNG